ncbi:MAG TPA: hypothetical protein VFA04_16650, partial [Bryobacteraceae bacterium]|nr:hypothetical protein [Bryobacteraceae bacterium]
VPQVRHRTEPPDLIVPERQRFRLEHLSSTNLPADLMPRDRERQQAVESGEVSDPVSRTPRQPTMEARFLVAEP